MTTLRDRIAAVTEARYGVCPPEFVGAILALFRDEAPPSDEVAARCLSVAGELAKGQIDEHDAEGALRTAAVRVATLEAEVARFEHNMLDDEKTIRELVTERAELQRRLEELTAMAESVSDSDDLIREGLESELAKAERERDAALEELRGVGKVLTWVPFDLEDFPEGNTALFRFVGADGADYYFVDRITWDSESPPQWDECSAGVEFDAVTHYALFNQLEAEARKVGTT